MSTQYIHIHTHTCTTYIHTHTHTYTYRDTYKYNYILNTVYRVSTSVTNVYVLFTVGRMNDVAECVASYQVLEPSDGTMDKNAFFYKSKLKIPEEKFIPRPVSVVRSALL